MTMDTEPSPEEIEVDVPNETDRDDIIDFLTCNNDICFKNQQKWEADLTKKEKFDIALELFHSSKLNFLIKFGKYLKHGQLGYFKRFTEHFEPDWEEINLVLTDLSRNCSESFQTTTVRNRRYEALKQMVQSESYFSEIEMMKRNPLLYEQLVGQYLSRDEKKERDKYKMDQQTTFVNILMEGIERDNAAAYKKKQEESEDDQMEETEDSSSDEELNRTSSPAPSSSLWGEFEKDKMYPARPKPKQHTTITAEERLLLKEEFITTMYESFLDGKDEDFNYGSVDGNSSFDNLHELEHDEEEKYFQTEEPGDIADEEVSSEDELDIYMSALSQHPAVCELSKELNKL